MFRKSITRKPIIILLLVLQFIPLVMFPASSFAPDSQEWWLPVLLAVMAIVAIFELVFRHNPAGWPLYLVGFAQGFNIISRLMMIMPHSTRNENGMRVFNTSYVVLSIASMLLSSFVLWYIELPEVKMNLMRK